MYTLDVPPGRTRPWVYANFVETLDGKVAILNSPGPSWPASSAYDFSLLMHLRAQADLLVHGRKTAQVYRALNRLEHPTFQVQRSGFGKNPYLPYAIVSKDPKTDYELFLSSSLGVPTYLVTLDQAMVPSSIENASSIVRAGSTSLDPAQFLAWCQTMKYERVLVEGGSELFQSFLAAGCIDELFLTIVPTLIGGRAEQTKTLLDHGLFPPNEIKSATLLSCHQEKNELFLRYRLNSSV